MNQKLYAVRSYMGIWIYYPDKHSPCSSVVLVWIINWYCLNSTARSRYLNWCILSIRLSPLLVNNCVTNKGRAETECDGTRKRTGGEVKGKKANGEGSQQSCTVSDTVYPAFLPLMRTPRLPAADWTDTTADINGLVRFAGKPNLVSARVPSRSVSALPTEPKENTSWSFRLRGAEFGNRWHKI